jgi:excisionase family DNA binding protein
MQNTTNSEPLTFSPQQTAYKMGIGKTKVFELIKQGKLKSFKYGSRRLITLEAIKECLVLLQKEGQI